MRLIFAVGLAMVMSLAPAFAMGASGRLATLSGTDSTPCFLTFHRNITAGQGVGTGGMGGARGCVAKVAGHVRVLLQHRTRSLHNRDFHRYQCLSRSWRRGTKSHLCRRSRHVCGEKGGQEQLQVRSARVKAHNARAAISPSSIEPRGSLLCHRCR